VALAPPDSVVLWTDTSVCESAASHGWSRNAIVPSKVVHL
jgi:hypothetical protein